MDTKDICSDSRIHTEITRSKLKFQDPHWNPKAHSGVPGSTLESQDAQSISRIHIVIPGPTLETQDPYHDLRYNLKILTENPESIMESQYAHVNPNSHWYPHWNAWIHTDILGPTLKYQNPPRNPRLHTEISAYTLESQHTRNIRIHTGILGPTFHIEDPRSILK